MTAKKDQTETLIEQALARRAEQAPTDGFLLPRVHSRLRRRRTGRRAGAALAAAAAVAAGIAGVNVLTGNDAAPPSESPQVAGASTGSRVAAAPAGWRWESYRGIELLVPKDWSYGTTGSPSCLVDKLGPPYVGRPGPVPMIGCPKGDLVKLAVRSSYAWLGGIDTDQVGIQQHDNGWVTESRNLAGTTVTVFTNDADLRRQILDSMRTFDGTDAYGCAASRPDWARDVRRPAAVDGGLASVGTVKSITVCTYTSDGKLFAGSARDGSVVQAILAAPPGSGPNTPDTCMEKYGREVVVLKVHGSKHDQDVLVRYHGCDHNGIDDGTTVRQLTREVVGPVLTGPHYPSSHSGSLNKILPPR